MPNWKRIISNLALLCIALAIPLAAQEGEYGASGDVPYVPTPPEIVQAMLKLGGVHAGDIHYDLGCGDGRIVISAVKDFGAARGTGYDINPERIREANENASKAGVTDKVKFMEKNIFEADFHDATIVTLYLLPSVNLRMRPRLVDQLPLGARIVSHSFSMDDWEPDQKVEIGYKTLYFWKITPEAKRKYGPPPASPFDGAWIFSMSSPQGDVPADLTMKMENGKLTGTFVFEGGRKLEIVDGTVNGKTATFTVKRDRPSGGTMVYKMTGTVDGNNIKGTTATEMDGQAANAEWSAKRK